LSRTDVNVRFSFPTRCLEYLSEFERKLDNYADLKVVLVREVDHLLGSQYKIEVKRRIILLGKEIWADTDIRTRFSFPTKKLGRLAGWEGQNYYVDLMVKDSKAKLWAFRCWKRRNGRHLKPWLHGEWLEFVGHYGLKIGDKVVLVREDDPFLGSQYRIEAKRRIILLGQEIWVDVIECFAELEEGQSHSVDLTVKDSRQRVWTFSCRKRRNGSHPKPWLSGEWLRFVKHCGLKIGDKVVMVQEDDQFLGSQYRIEAKRRIIVLGQGIWADV
ncbi:hypothetical protein Tsubulata_042956, partial [Turnera subulata]